MSQGGVQMAPNGAVGIQLYNLSYILCYPWRTAVEFQCRKVSTLCVLSQSQMRKYLCENRHIWSIVEKSVDARLISLFQSDCSANEKRIFFAGLLVCQWEVEQRLHSLITIDM